MHIFSHKTVQLFVRSLKAYYCRDNLSSFCYMLVVTNKIIV